MTARLALRRWGGRLGGPLLAAYRRHRHRPALSVVMPVYNVAAYLPEALDSALGQTLTDLELIVVDDGSTDGCPEILRDYERRDYRVRVLTQANAGQGVARNLGVEHARGEFLTFLDSDDTLPRDAYATMVEGLRASGSDLSVGNLRRLRHGQLHRMIWSRTVHRQDRIGTTLEEFPEAMQDIIACNRMFRTAFWRDRIEGFRGGIAYEDHVPMLAAYVRAGSIDVLQKVTYHWRIREDLTSTGQQKARIQNLRDRIAVMHEAHELLQAEASAEVYAAWVGRALEVDFAPFLPFALTGDAAYRSLLAETYRLFLDRVTSTALSQVRVAMRVRAHLAAQERWDELFEADDWLREVQNLPPTEVVDGALVAAFPASCTWASALPDDQLWLAPLESHFEGAVEHLAWEPDVLRITGWAWLRGLDMQDPVVRAWLVDGDDRVQCSVQSLVLPEAEVWGPLSFASPAAGGFVVTVPNGALAESGRTWSVVVEVSQQGLVASGPLHGQVARSAAVAPSYGVIDGLGVTTGFDPADGLTLTVGLAVDRTGHPVEVLDAVVSGDTLVLTTTGSPITLALTGPDLDGVDRPVPCRTVVLAAALSPSYAGTAPHRLDAPHHAVQVGQRPDGTAVVVLAPPLRPDELGQVNRQRQRTRYAALDEPLRDAVLLDGKGDQVALDRWLAAERPEVSRTWTVADRSTAVPDGAQAVLRESREWYDALATSRLVVLDDDLGPWVRRREGQRYLRTFATHPYEPLGVDAWRRDGMIEHLVNREVVHRAREWDVLLAPDAETVPLLRAAYRWEGEVLLAGSPRTDLLLGDDRAAVRARLLRRLGLADTTLVLHAPAARDEHDVARPEGLVDLDLVTLARTLGPSYTVLRRTDPADRRPAPALDGVVDVSAYPWLEDLLVAADVAVLDYSGLRFDWALTGRPAIFHVPDSAAWWEFRSPLLPWAATTPGPEARTTDEVAAYVRDAAGVEAAYAGQVAAFNERFHALDDGHVAQRVLRDLL